MKIAKTCGKSKVEFELQKKNIFQSNRFEWFKNRIFKRPEHGQITSTKVYMLFKIEKVIFQIYSKP